MVIYFLYILATTFINLITNLNKKKIQEEFVFFNGIFTRFVCERSNCIFIERTDCIIKNAKRFIKDCKWQSLVVCALYRIT